MAGKQNGLKSNWSRVWGKQLADKEMCENTGRVGKELSVLKRKKKSRLPPTLFSGESSLGHYSLL